MPAVLITGASRGFGRELSVVYARRGWQTFPLIRNGDLAEDLRNDLGSKSHPIVADVTSEEVESEISRVLKLHGGVLDVLINNAGIIRKCRGLQNTSVTDLRDLFEVHCIGVMRCTKAALPFLEHSKRAVIVNISSRWSSIARTASGAGGGIYSYQMAKCAQNMLTVCMDRELCDARVRVLAVHPGRLKTTVGAADADTSPQEAAVALADWIERVGPQTPCVLHDLLGGGHLDW